MQINQEGVTYNTATAPDGTTATVCLTVPYHVCEGTPFDLLLSAPAYYSTYQWSRNGTLIAGATSPNYSATAIGEYTVATTSTGECPDGSCCPLVVVQDPAPGLTAVAVAATCNGATPKADARITLAASSTNAVSYNIALGSSFSAGAAFFNSPQSLSGVAAGGTLLANQPNPASAPGTSYTIRVYSAADCFSDTVVVIPPAMCVCPIPVCVPFSVMRVIR